MPGVLERTAELVRVGVRPAEQRHVAVGELRNPHVAAPAIAII